ncbi:FAD-dependent monooxygenase [Pseudonocardia nantongensis]|uniref:FAD-dependent monooxygenase n=1 Tax=Pseudonocardia nantongensis TaxID=1181885 RepID=UPI003977F875
MGVAGELERRGFHLRELRTVTATGRKMGSLDVAGVADGAGERYVSIARSDLAEVLLAEVPDRVELIRGDTVASLEDDGDRVRVGLAGGATVDADLVVGADGLHSQVRRLPLRPGRPEAWARRWIPGC